MPDVTIEVRRKYTPAEEERIIAAVHAALMEGLHTPDWDRTIRLMTHEMHCFAVPPGCGDRYTLIDIDLFSGRSLPAKRVLYRAPVCNLGELGTRKQDRSTSVIATALIASG